MRAACLSDDNMPLCVSPRIRDGIWRLFSNCNLNFKKRFKWRHLKTKSLFGFKLPIENFTPRYTTNLNIWCNLAAQHDWNSFPICFPFSHKFSGNILHVENIKRLHLVCVPHAISSEGMPGNMETVYHASLVQLTAVLQLLVTMEETTVQHKPEGRWVVFLWLKYVQE